MRYLALLLFCTNAAIGLAAEVEIVSFNNGYLSWEDTNTNVNYSVERQSSITNPQWSSDSRSLEQFAATGGVITAEVPMFYRVIHRPRLSNTLILVPAGGQPLGPTHNFYMAQYETTVSQYAEFLNNAQANTGNARGANMYFETGGDVRMSAAGSYLFDISDSYLIYDKNATIGQRYTIFPLDRGNHPITGVSLYGAIKYCNWLTIEEGIGTDQRCYSEGLSDSNWHPANVTDAEWQSGFEVAQRFTWISNYRGYRLPMVFTEGASFFDEFYKSAAWNGIANTVYGFGRNSLAPSYANYQDSGDPFEAYSIGTTPVGYYNGGLNDGFQTSSNINAFAIYDLSGNVAEWATGNGSSSDPWSGGAWIHSSGTCNSVPYLAAQWETPCKDDSASSTLNWIGFRIVRSNL